jgi:ketosteroid isomerase-like protein
MLLAAGAGSPSPASANAAHVEEAEKRAVLEPIDALFAAMRAGDGNGILAHAFPDGRVTATGERSGGAKGLRASSWAEFAGRITPASAFDEQITDPEIRIDGDVALVWASFVVRRNGKVLNCGYDLFDLVRVNGDWKIMNLSFSSRITNCGN